MSRNEKAHASPADAADADRPYPHPPDLGVESSPTNGEPPAAYYDAVHQEAKRLLTAGPYLTFAALVEMAGFNLDPVEKTNVQIGKLVGRHPSTIRSHLAKIEAAGLIRREELDVYGCLRRIHFAYKHPGVRRGALQRAPSPHKNARDPLTKSSGIPPRNRAGSPHESARPILIERLEEENSTLTATGLSTPETPEPDGLPSPVESEADRQTRIASDFASLPASERESIEKQVRADSPSIGRFKRMLEPLLLAAFEKAHPDRYPKVEAPAKPPPRPSAAGQGTITEQILRLSDPAGPEAVHALAVKLATKLEDPHSVAMHELVLNGVASGLADAEYVACVYRMAREQTKERPRVYAGKTLKPTIAKLKTARRVAVESYPAGGSPMRFPLDNIIR
jgi:hypothetical protein